MRRALLLLLFLFTCTTGRAELSFASAHAIVVDEQSGEVLLQKDEASAAPIASLTKLMTAMVVLDAQQDPNELLRFDPADTDPIRHGHGGVPIGALAPRGSLLDLALLASDNRAASALARHHPGGLEGFAAAMQRKIQALSLYGTH